MISKLLSEDGNLARPSVAAVAACAAILYLIAVVIYRIFFHPLASYPGPLLGKITSLYALYYSYRGKIHHDIQRCHEQYGNIVRYRPNALVFNDAKALQDIYVSPSKTQKAIGYTGQRDGSKTFSIINSITREEHAPRRKLLSHAFSTAALKQYEPLIYDICKKFNDRLLEDAHGQEKKGGWGPVLDVGSISSYFTYDVMSNVVFYSPKDLMQKTEGRHVIDGIESAMFFTGMQIEWPWLVTFRIYRQIFFPKHRDNTLTFRDTTVSMAMDRIALGQKQEVNDIFAGLMKGDSHGEHGLSVTDLAADAMVLVIAGTDTSSTAISAFCFYLAKHPEAYERLASEVRTAFGNAEEITPGPALTGCTYLLACIDEAMRLSPSVSAPLWRTMRHQDTVSGVVVPAGTDVSSCSYAIHRNPEYFPDPHEFRPERWLPKYTGEAQIKAAKSAFIPFSLGSRGCLGKNVAYMELMTALAQMVFRMDWQFADGAIGKTGEETAPDGKHVNFGVKAHFTSSKDGPFIQFKPRDITA